MKRQTRRNQCIFCDKPGKYYYDRRLIRWLNEKYDMGLTDWTGVYVCDPCKAGEIDADLQR